MSEKEMSPHLPPGPHIYLHHPLRILMKITFNLKPSWPRSWCNVCEEHHEESTCEVKKNAIDKIFGKRPENTIVVLDFAEQEDVMIVNTRNKSYAPKGKYDPPRTSSSPSSYSPAAIVKVSKAPDSQGTTSPLPNKTFSINWIILKLMPPSWTWFSIPEQQNHLKNFMEEKASIIANLSEEVDEEDSTVNKVGVHNFRHPVKNPPFFIFVNIMEKISHYCLIDSGSGPSVMSKIIMEELGLSCTNENSRSMISYNSLQQNTIGEIKDMTSVLCMHPEIRTTLNIKVIDMPISNYSIILGRD
jgi:hypothetical protein